MVTKTSLRASLVQMKAGEVLRFPLEGRSPIAVRNCASLLGLNYPGRKYSVSIHRETLQCSITRVQ